MNMVGIGSGRRAKVFQECGFVKKKFYYYMLVPIGRSAHQVASQRERNCTQLQSNLCFGTCAERARERKTSSLYVGWLWHGIEVAQTLHQQSSRLCVRRAKSYLIAWIIVNNYHHRSLRANLANNFCATLCENSRPIATNSQKWRKKNFVEGKERKIVKNIQLQLRHVSHRGENREANCKKHR